MKRLISLSLLAMPFLLAAAPTPQSTDPFKIRPGETWLDTSGKPIAAHGGGILFHEGYYYWYGEKYGPNPARGEERTERGVRLYKSRDLATWEDLGNVLQVKNEPGHPIQVGSVIERPKIVYNKKTGKFVMWFHNELKGRGYGAAWAGVAVADKVEGPYEFVRSGRGPKGIWPMNARPTGPAATTRPASPYACPPGLRVLDFDPLDPNFKRLSDGYLDGQESRDMTIFVDDDGKAYHLYSSEMNATLHIAELTDDYLDYTGRYVRAFWGQMREAPAPFKHNGKYYMITSGCTGWAPNPADLAEAPTIWGPWHTARNPWVGPEAETKTSYRSQSTFVFQVSPGKFLYMGDRWQPRDLDTSPYVWTPIEFEGDKMVLKIRPEWDIRELTGKVSMGQ